MQHVGTTAVYDLQERNASSKADAIRKLVGENQRQSTPRFKVYGFQFTGQGPHRAFTQDWLEDVWSAQVVASWITDWRIWKENFPEQVGMVSAQGFSPSDITPLSPKTNRLAFPTTHGQVTLDLSTVLDPAFTIGDGIIQGPDGIYGPSTDSLFYEYARTGKVFGETVPAVAKPVFDRILSSITTQDIQQGLSERAAGQVAPRESADKMESSSLSGDAQINSGYAQTKPSYSLGQNWSTLISPNMIKKTLDPNLMANIAKFRNIKVPVTAAISPAAIPSKSTSKPPPGVTPPIYGQPKVTVASKGDRPFYKEPLFYIGVPFLLIGTGVGIYLYNNRK